MWALLLLRTGSFWVVLGCPVHCRMLCSIPGPSALDARSNPPKPLFPKSLQPKGLPHTDKCPWGRGKIVPTADHCSLRIY